MIGLKLNNLYTIKSRAGEGGMGEVYLATNEQTGGQVAVKVLARQLTMHPESLERFRREAQTLRQLDHPNIVKFVDAFEYDGQYVIVMEYISGGSLHDLIKQGPLPVERARQIALDLCDALIRAHRLNIIHRDLKPENILIDKDGTPKLADFGVARLSEGTRMTRSGTQVGTPYYMAPEAWEGKMLDAQADIWSLGVMLFEMLTGQVPFGGDTGAAVMNKILTTQLPDVKKVRAEVPLNLIQIIKRMLTRDKRRRYQTMREVAVDLERGQRAMTAIAAKAKPTRRLATIIGIGLLLTATSIWFATRATDTFEATPTLSRAGEIIATANALPTATASIVPPTPTFSPIDLAEKLDLCSGDICISSLSNGQTSLGLKETFSGLDNLDIFSWSPAGSQIVFSAYLAEDLIESPSGGFGEDLFIINRDGSGLTRITQNRDWNTNPVWSPDGEWIAYTGEGALMLIRPDGTGKKKLTTTDSFFTPSAIAWSPDGQQVAWTALGPDSNSIFIIWIINKDGTGIKQILRNDEFTGWKPEIAWSPDGELIVFKLANGKIYTMNITCDGQTSCGDAEEADISFPEEWTSRYYPQWAGENGTQTP